MYTHEFVQHPAGGEYERDVGDHEDHRSPVDPYAARVVIVHDDVRDDGVLDPLHGVGSRVQDENGQHQPSPFVQFVFRGFSHGLYGVWSARFCVWGCRVEVILHGVRRIRSHL